ncbi:unnamed protein product [marine sediment metagenome]|uniref:Uncharacterized protein n=1 Tax=marine sediment metagenome TaxID=412755 RepID=X1NEL1_9ZZZZ
MKVNEISLKTRKFGKPWADHPMYDEKRKCFTCAFCTREAVDKEWLGGYTGVLVCEEHSDLLKKDFYESMMKK